MLSETEAAMIRASHELATMPVTDPRFNYDPDKLIRDIMLAEDNIAEVIFYDHPDPKKREIKMVLERPWKRAECIETAQRLGAIFSCPIYYVEKKKAPETQGDYTQKQARGATVVEYKRAGRHLTRR